MLLVTFEENLGRSDVVLFKPTIVNKNEIEREEVFTSPKYGSFRLSEKHKNKYYVVFNKPTSFERSITICNEVGGLPIFEDESDHRFFNQLAGNMIVWIGGRFKNNFFSKKIAWANLKSVDINEYNHWASGQPTCSDSCGIVMYHGEWYTNDIRTERYFICRANKDFLELTDAKAYLRTIYSNQNANNERTNSETENNINDKSSLYEDIRNLSIKLDSQSSEINKTNVEINKIYQQIDKVKNYLEEKLNNSTEKIDLNIIETRKSSNETDEIYNYIEKVKNELEKKISNLTETLGTKLKEVFKNTFGSFEK